MIVNCDNSICEYNTADICTKQDISIKYNMCASASRGAATGEIINHEDVRVLGIEAQVYNK